MFYDGVYRARKEKGFLGMDDGKKGKAQGNDPLHRHRWDGISARKHFVVYKILLHILSHLTHTEALWQMSLLITPFYQ